ncbi:MAG: hypothetical protein KR126chlam2_01413, partial [Chlamydiae bacterium]|nr:hypothetical protein [Chlamydiota bacterium]
MASNAQPLDSAASQSVEMEEASAPVAERQKVSSFVQTLLKSHFEFRRREAWQGLCQGRVKGEPAVAAAAKSSQQSSAPITPEVLIKLLKDVTYAIADCEDPFKAIDLLAALVPLEKLESGLKSSDKKFDVNQYAQRLLRIADYDAEFNKSGLSSALRTQLLFVWSAFTNALFIVLE